MPETWTDALNLYRYPADLRTFKEADLFPGFFQRNIDIGDRKQTIDFENHFRRHAEIKVAVWSEVVYWKYYSQNRREYKTIEVIEKIEDILPCNLLKECNNFICKPSKETFNNFRKLFNFKTTAIATVATFPSFLDPDNFPMVDTRIAKWIGKFGQALNLSDQSAPRIILPEYYLAKKSTVLTMKDYTFFESWTYWCRHMAKKLTQQTSMKWRARDVEMAVFTAADSKKPLKLNLLPPV